jgi:hypothetical protein
MVSGNIMINNNLARRNFCGSRKTSKPDRGGKVEVTGALTLEFDGTTQYQDFLTATSRALAINFTGATISGTAAYGHNFYLQNTRFTGNDPKVNNEGIIQVELPFKSYENGTDSRELELTLTNALASI